MVGRPAFNSMSPGAGMSSPGIIQISQVFQELVDGLHAIEQSYGYNNLQASFGGPIIPDVLTAYGSFEATGAADIFPTVSMQLRTPPWLSVRPIVSGTGVPWMP